MIERDSRPVVHDRQTGKKMVAYATECTCAKYVPQAVVEMDINAICRDCHSIWRA